MALDFWMVLKQQWWDLFRLYAITFFWNNWSGIKKELVTQLAQFSVAVWSSSQNSIVLLTQLLVVKEYQKKNSRIAWNWPQTTETLSLATQSAQWAYRQMFRIAVRSKLLQGESNSTLNCAAAANEGEAIDRYQSAAGYFLSIPATRRTTAAQLKQNNCATHQKLHPRWLP